MSWSILERDRFWAKVDRRGPNECWVWIASRTEWGYGALTVAGRKKKLAHRVAFELAFGPIPTGLQVCHRCDNPPCCNPAHLFAGTQRDNVLDMYRKGRNGYQGQPGERHPQARLTAAQVAEIRSRWAVHPRPSQVDLAAEFGVARSHISGIVNRHRWKGVVAKS